MIIYKVICLESICKCLEKLVREHMIGYMKENNVFSKKQYVFIMGCSTTLQLLKVLDKWTEALDAALSIDCIYIWTMQKYLTMHHMEDLFTSYQHIE